MTSETAAPSHPGAMPEPRDAPAGGRTLALRRANPQGASAGPPVLLLHGVPETSRTWRHLLPELARDRVVLAPDLPGLGGSSPDGPFDLGSVAATLEAFLVEEVGSTSVDVVGHDWGGGAALVLATVHPERVRRLVVVSAPWRSVDLLRGWHIPLFGYGPSRLFERAGSRLVDAMLRYAWRGPRPLERDVRRAYRQAYAAPERVASMLGYYRAAVRREKPSGPPQGGPRPERSLVVWGVRDPSVPQRSGEKVVRDLGRTADPASIRMLTVPGVGHWPHEEAPDVVVPEIAAFLREG